MSDITPASTNVLYHGDVNFKNPTPVIELYPRAYGQQDEFVPAEGGKGNRKAPSFLGSFLKYLAITGAVVFAGRKGLFGKKIKGWLGGLPKAVKPEEVFSRIETKMAEFLGKGGDVVTSSKIATAADGTSVLRAEFQSGAVREYQLKEGDNVIKLICRDAGTETNPLRKIFGKTRKSEKVNLEQYVLFDKADGAVRFRTDLARGADGKVRAYASYKGETVLEPDFNEVTGIFKDYHKEYGFFGPRFEQSEVRLFNNPTSGEPSVIKSKRTYRKNGKLRRYIQEDMTKIRKFIYDKKGNLENILNAPKA